MTGEEEDALAELERAEVTGLDAVAFALIRLARETSNVAYAIRCLGNGNAATQMGAIEAYSIVVRDGLERIADALDKGR